jgi:hypothetical protein
MTTFDRLRKHLDSKPETRVMWAPDPPENAMISTVRFLCDLIDQQAAELARLREAVDAGRDDGR